MNAAEISAIAQSALDVQDACNGPAVARLYVRVTDALIAANIRGDALRAYPAVVLIAHKLADLSRVADLCPQAYADAYSQCLELAGMASAAEAA